MRVAGVEEGDVPAHSKDDFIGSGGGGLVDGSGGDLGGCSLGKGEVMGKVMKRDGGLVEAINGLRGRFQAKREPLKMLNRNLLESQGRDLASTVLHVPNSSW